LTELRNDITELVDVVGHDEAGDVDAHGDDFEEVLDAGRVRGVVVGDCTTKQYY
jgi:hypothetical protein